MESETAAEGCGSEAVEVSIGVIGAKAITSGVLTDDVASVSIAVSSASSATETSSTTSLSSFPVSAIFSDSVGSLALTSQ